MFDPSAAGVVQPGVFCAAVLLLNLTPGPDTAFIVGQSVAFGRRAGMLSVLGISTGCALHTIALAVGLSALLVASPSVFVGIRALGAAYLVFLGARMWMRTVGGRSAKQNVAAESPRSDVRASRRPAGRIFVQGFLTNALNPKVILFFLSFFPQFVDAGSTTKGTAFVVLGAVMTAITTIYNGAVAWLAGGITRRVRSLPRVKVWLDRSIGCAFVALGARIAFDR